jgi:hypothetical protein
MRETRVRVDVRRDFVFSKKMRYAATAAPATSTMSWRELGVFVALSTASSSPT